jgi:hypothetical protein
MEVLPDSFQIYTHEHANKRVKGIGSMIGLTEDS